MRVAEPVSARTLDDNQTAMAAATDAASAQSREMGNNEQFYMDAPLTGAARWCELDRSPYQWAVQHPALPGVANASSGRGTRPRDRYRPLSCGAVFFLIVLWVVGRRVAVVLCTLVEVLCTVDVRCAVAVRLVDV